MSRKLSNRSCPILSHILLGVVGLAIAIWYGAMAISATRSISWPSVTGTVKDVRSVSVSHYSRYGGRTRYYPKVSYRYSLNHTDYLGEFDYYADESRDQQGFKARFWPHKQVLVYYNPAHAQESVLVPGYNLAMNVLESFAGIALLCGAIALSLPIDWPVEKPLIYVFCFGCLVWLILWWGDAFF